MKRINENQKITLTIGQLKRLVRESKKSDFEIKNGVLVKYNGKGGDVVIPDGVTRIGENVFTWCTELTSVTIPNSVTSIGNSAFDACYGLTSVTIPNSVTRIEDAAFYRCGGLASVTIGNSVTNIGAGAFEYCSNLKSVTIPSSVTSIGRCAFWHCSELANVKILNSKLFDKIDRYEIFYNTPYFDPTIGKTTSNDIEHDAENDDDLHTFIGGYLFNSRKWFLSHSPRTLAKQFMDEYETELDFDDIVAEIKRVQDDPSDYIDMD